MKRLSRREFVAFSGMGAAVAPWALGGTKARAGLTAQDVVDRVKQRAGVAWKSDTVDGFKAGDPAAKVTGIVTTALPTLAVLKDAVGRGANLIITSEPAFYAKADSPAPAGRRGGGPGAPPVEAPADPVFTAKREFIAKNGLVIWRFGDHWRLRTPDPAVQSMGERLGLSPATASDGALRFTVRPTSLETLASDIRKRLGARGGVRVVGDPSLTVQRIGLLPGVTPIQATLALLPAVDLVIAGEVREWESVEYARDLETSGARKALVTVGRVVSEDPGMRACAEWLGTIVPEVKTHWTTAGDPYWRPL